MANAQDPDYGELDPTFVEDELDDQAPLGSSGLRASFNTMLGMGASRAKEDMSFAGKGVKPDLAEILDPSIITKMYIAGELQRQPQSALFVKPQKGKKIQQQQTDLLPTDEITDQAKTMGSYQPAPAPPPPPPMAQAPPVVTPPVVTPPVVTPPVKPPPVVTGTAVTISNKPEMTILNQTFKYLDLPEAKALRQAGKIPNVADIGKVKDFLAKHLRTDDLKTEKQVKDFLSTKQKSGKMIPAKEVKDLLRTYFPKIAGRKRV